MNFVSENIYHIYNRGNNRQTIFFNEGNYIYFLNKVRKYILPHCSILSYVLMPNHFHFLIHADDRTETELAHLPITSNVLSNGFRLLLSSYSKGINKQEGRTGNLLQQKTKSKCVSDIFDTRNRQYAATCFYYIHQNPVKAGLVEKAEDWHYSSCKDFSGLRNGTLCNKELASDVLDISIDKAGDKVNIDEELLKHIW